MASVATQITSGIAILEINNPPVNSLALHVRVSLYDAVSVALANPAVKGIVIRGAGSNFCGGADLSEFRTGKIRDWPRNADLIGLIEGGDKPVVAALHGKVLGGGFELVLGCHERIGTRHAQFRLPEVTLGLLPGAGGTQRLPRLIGFEAAREAICEGGPISADEAIQLGLLGGVVENEELTRLACEMALHLAEHHLLGVPLPRVRDMPSPTLAWDAPTTDQRKDVLRRRWAGYPARIAALDAVLAATQFEFEAGLVEERRLVDILLASPECAALRYVFASDREVRKPQNVKRHSSSSDKSSRAQPSFELVALGDSIEQLGNALGAYAGARGPGVSEAHLILLGERKVVEAAIQELERTAATGHRMPRVFGLQPARQPFPPRSFEARAKECRAFEIYEPEQKGVSKPELIRDAVALCWELGYPTVETRCSPRTASETLSTGIEELATGLSSSEPDDKAVERAFSRYGFDPEWCAMMVARMGARSSDGSQINRENQHAAFNVDPTQLIDQRLGALTARLIMKGVARTQGEIDWMWRSAYGFPPYKGGFGFRGSEVVDAKARDDER